MFTGIVECVGELTNVLTDNTNLHFTVKSDISKDLKIDQSISHDGVCLTVIDVNGDTHTVTAVQETLNITTLHTWKMGQKINLERCMSASGRFDGHIVQGHVDCVGEIIEILDENGSTRMRISFDENKGLIVPKGSITVNGVSLTVAEYTEDVFSVVIIPYTWENTNLGKLSVGKTVNLEFDIIGKYIQKQLSRLH